MTLPFLYPASTHTRRHGPQGYGDYESYRPWLRDEFTFRCIYCLLREQWGRVRGSFDIDHFLPVARSPERGADYDNLLYTCSTCNGAKGALEVPDPCRALLREDIRVFEDGSIEASTREARRLIQVLGLNGAESVEFRMLWIGIIALAARHDRGLYQRLMGFPETSPTCATFGRPEEISAPRGSKRPTFSRRNEENSPMSTEPSACPPRPRTSGRGSARDRG